MIYKKIEIKVEGYQETADLYTYILDNSVEMHPDRKRPVVVICPGGGYETERPNQSPCSILQEDIMR